MKPLSVLLDARKLGDGGIGIYIENLIEGLIDEKRHGFPLKLTLITEPCPRSDLLGRYCQDIEVAEDSARKYSFDEYLRLPKRLSSLFRGHDVFHSPHYTLPRGIRIPTVVTIHDTIHLTAPENFLQKFIGGFLIRSALRRANRVITVSGVSLARLGRVIPGVPVTVIPNALASNIGPVSIKDVGLVLGKYGIRQPCVLFVGSERNHKGFDLLLDAMAGMSEFSPLLVVVGGRFSQRTRLQATSKLGADRVTFLGEVSRKDLVALYNGARAVVVPSRIEGFGLVALEALACGAPLVCSPELSLKEVAGNCAWYAQGFKSDDLLDSLKSCFTNKEIADEKAAAGVQRAAEFTIARFTEAHLKVYLDLLPAARAKLLSGVGSFDEEPLSYLREEEAMWGSVHHPLPNDDTGPQIDIR